MNNHLIQISRYDFALLNEMILEKWHQGTQNERVTQLNNKLDNAQVVSEFDFPPDVITLNSRMSIEELHTGQNFTRTLVVNAAVESECRVIPILSRLGVAIIGQTVGSCFSPMHSAQCPRFRIRQILYQPEIEFRRYYIHMKSIVN